jgi:hypothetical protein
MKRKFRPVNSFSKFLFRNIEQKTEGEPNLSSFQLAERVGFEPTTTPETS